MKPEPGYKLDWLIAEKVMGWTQEEGAWLDSDGRRCGYTYRWEPSRHIAAAWQVVERLIGLGYTFDLYCYRAEDWGAIFEKDDDAWEELADTAPHAISLAALATMEKG